MGQIATFWTFALWAKIASSPENLIGISGLASLSHREPSPNPRSHRRSNPPSSRLNLTLILRTPASSRSNPNAVMAKDKEVGPPPPPCVDSDHEDLPLAERRRRLLRPPAESKPPAPERCRASLFSLFCPADVSFLESSSLCCSGAGGRLAPRRRRRRRIPAERRSRWVSFDFCVWLLDG